MALIEKNMYRSVRKDEFTEGVLKPDGEAMDGILHGDIDPRTVIVRGEATTRQDWRRGAGGYFRKGYGTSLWDKIGVFGNQNWHYFTLPKGTVIPDSLKLVEGEWSNKYHATHWQIEVANGGQLRTDALKGALDNLARNCIVRAREIGLIGD